MSNNNHFINSRVNITVDIEKNGAKEKMELPLNVLVIDDFSPGLKKKNLLDQDKLLVNKKNINEVMKEIKPELSIVVENRLSEKNDEINVNLKFGNINDFKPESIVQQIPALKKILAMRALLKELKTNITNSNEFRKILEKIMSDPNGLENLKKQLPNNIIGE